MAADTSDPAVSSKAPLVSKAKASVKKTAVEPKTFTQLSPVETGLVKLELRHRLMTVVLILALFGVIWLLFRFTGIDEKIYSIFKIVS